MKLTIKKKFYEVAKPKVQDGTFTIKTLATNAVKGDSYYRLVKRTGAVKVIFPDLPQMKFYLHANELEGITITEGRTGLALHKMPSNKSVELCLSEATAKLEKGFYSFRGPKGFAKHIASLPSKEEIVGE